MSTSRDATGAVADRAAALRAIFDGAIARLDPAARVTAALDGDAGAWLDGAREVVVIAIGKAAIAMARGAAAATSIVDRAGRGLVVAPAGAAASSVAALRWPLRIAAHPIPDARSEAAGRALLALAATVPRDGALLALISGGASALAAVPAPGLTLVAKAAAIDALMRAGAPIAELNRARAARSAIKAGRLADACPGRVLTLVISDVVGDDPAIVGSGPTVPASTPRLHDPAAASARVVVDVIAGVGALAHAAVAAARARGLDAEVGATDVIGDVADVAARVAAIARTAGPWWIASGEPTVRLPPTPGQGGRARQLALRIARAIAGVDAAVMIAGSDGVDGTGPAAGAIVDGTTWARLAAAGLDGDRAIAACDAGPALAAIGAEVGAGPTGVNHADLIVVARPARAARS